MITGAVVDLSVAYNTVSYQNLLAKDYDMMHVFHLVQLIRSLLENRPFYVKLCKKWSHWRQQRNGLPLSSVLVPLLFNIYTNHQPIQSNTIHADNLCIMLQEKDFTTVETRLPCALSNFLAYCNKNHLHSNPTKMQVAVFQLRHPEATQKLSITWYGIPLADHPNPVYLGMTLDRVLSFKAHVEKMNGKVSVHNNILLKLVTSKWRANSATLQTTATALCYSIAEYV